MLFLISVKLCHVTRHTEERNKSLASQLQVERQAVVHLKDLLQNTGNAIAAVEGTLSQTRDTQQSTITK